MIHTYRDFVVSPVGHPTNQSLQFVWGVFILIALKGPELTNTELGLVIVKEMIHFFVQLHVLHYMIYSRESFTMYN